jgi:hypothetical protein
MKKIFTIMLVAAGTIGVASAQSDKGIAFNGGKKMSNYQHAGFGKGNMVSHNDAFLFKQKEAKIGQINREFGQKIFLIKNDRHLRSGQKVRQIRMLQNQRKNEISKIEFQYAQNQKAGKKMYGNDSHNW